MLVFEEGTKYIVTTDAWFFAPNGQSYRAVWGEVRILPDSVLGVKTNSRSANWYARVGTDEDHVVVAGCQIHYAVRSEKPPQKEFVKDYSTDKGVVTNFKRPSMIYITNSKTKKTK